LEVLTVLERNLALIFPNKACAVFALEPDDSALRVISRVNFVEDLRLGSQLQLGEGVSGWVAVNRQIAFNSDPAFDFGSPQASRFRQCISAPLFSEGGNLSGVITVYSEMEPFLESHVKGLEEATAVGSLIVHFSKTRQPKQEPQLHLA
jgi:hypothetical protein